MEGWGDGGMGVDDLRQKYEGKCEGKGMFGTDKRHKRGGWRQEIGKMCVWYEYIRNIINGAP